MAEEKLLTVREVSSLLDISEKDVLDLAESGSIPAYKVGGVYLRFKPSQVEEFRKKSKSVGQKPKNYSFTDRVFDFVYFNDFYLLSGLLIAGMLFFILRP
ncbi:MAG: helix-turn-helix domain-containing protein [Candidatus Omnitrophica bacterium]|jgi:excisionase family DNA binding protein|nr:helix-turn-helix domain-containing protein [Candidatus Omnitrophota bacterium]